MFTLEVMETVPTVIKEFQYQNNKTIPEVKKLRKFRKIQLTFVWQLNKKIDDFTTAISLLYYFVGWKSLCDTSLTHLFSSVEEAFAEASDDGY